MLNKLLGKLSATYLYLVLTADQSTKIKPDKLNVAPMKARIILSPYRGQKRLIRACLGLSGL